MKEKIVSTLEDCFKVENVTQVTFILFLFDYNLYSFMH